MMPLKVVEISLYRGKNEVTMKPKEFIDLLVYASYKANRQHSPDITPTQWGRFYGWNVFVMEAKYQLELRKN